ncbi:UDP-N-acetylmuramoylalanine--D-glutamate ligase [Candidatus Roizmanbacteria bacterium RIFCSPHIGHO2_02_FULL_38_11]|uniref:UDP-N-acetylmuramoylalanine--D-glutamate ligase n=1 Tax=Candidatus Roizmanbacteria bacterium RIFCSPHIGHO2_02_FULL_38_11 TaxID=1802039 RepID=A0A1F7H0W9_9BACT|nr:MAG: UDP-N-acetylmuramoylalanine--D-glutamate ligase [Candidatus Roizmanbacteria bacterium RIFCSPHIGHO2_02_FULL_38_11]
MADLIERLKTQFKAKKVLVVGLGLQGGGVGVAKFFAQIGAKVKVTDKKTRQQLNQSINKLIAFDISYTLGRHELSDFLESDIIFKAPKMRWDDPLIRAAQEKGITVEMETSFFSELCPAPIIGITGTRGKSTTTMMIYEILKKYSGRIVHLAGNIPQTSTIQLLNSIHKKDLVVMELSSWQLSGFHRKKISPHIAVLTNFYPDHLDYYKSMDEFLFDKKAIYLYQKSKDYLIANKSLKEIVAKDIKEGKNIYFSSSDFPGNLLHLKGVHNKENAAATLAVAKILNLDLYRCIDTLTYFKGLPYRQEIIAEKGGVVFINDTTSTTPTAAIKALETFSSYSIVLILGGNSKRLPANVLIDRLTDTYKIVLLKGSFTDEIITELKYKFPGKITIPYDNLEAAVKKAYDLAKQKLAIDKRSACVLFSPGATSFAMFNNEFHRGDEFNRIVKVLK